MPSIEHSSRPTCFLAKYRRDVPCKGQLRKVHLVDKQQLKRVGHDPWDERTWIWACGGPWPGLSGHHGLLDSHRLQVPYSALPAPLVALCEELGLGGWLERRYR